MTDNICEICMDKPNCNKFNCITCKNTVCIDCFKKISCDYFDEYNNIMSLIFVCPVCRTEATYTYDDFDKEDIVYLVNSHFTNMANSHLKYITELKDTFRNSIDELIRSRVIEKTEEYNKKILTMKKNLRFLCERDKNKTVGKFLIEPLYKIDW